MEHGTSDSLVLQFFKSKTHWTPEFNKLVCSPQKQAMKTEAIMLTVLRKKVSKYFPSTAEQSEGPEKRAHTVGLMKIWKAETPPVGNYSGYESQM